jgi:hypothetical protein
MTEVAMATELSGRTRLCRPLGLDRNPLALSGSPSIRSKPAREAKAQGPCEAQHSALSRPLIARQS